MSAAEIRDRLIAQRVIPALHLADARLAREAAECLIDAGFGALEIDLTTPGAVELIRSLAPRVLVGAGTVLDLETAHRCLRAGARFIASPVPVPGVAGEAHVAGCAALLGGFTPAEVLAAHRDGADIVTVFPASSGGPEHLRALHGVFPQLPLCPAGGVSLDDLRAYFTAGAACVGIGHDLVDQRALAAGDIARVIDRARAFLLPEVTRR